MKILKVQTLRSQHYFGFDYIPRLRCRLVSTMLTTADLAKYQNAVQFLSPPSFSGHCLTEVSVPYCFDK